MAEEWRVEADEEWLAEHSSDSFDRLSRRLRSLGLIANAISNAETGPFAGAPRNPRLKIESKSYGVVRYAQHQLAYTAVVVDPDVCRCCGEPLEERSAVLCLDEEGQRQDVGAIRVCSRCHADSWVFHSRMPTVARARKVARKVVL